MILPFYVVHHSTVAISLNFFTFAASSKCVNHVDSPTPPVFKSRLLFEDFWTVCVIIVFILENETPFYIVFSYFVIWARIGKSNLGGECSDFIYVPRFAWFFCPGWCRYLCVSSFCFVVKRNFRNSRRLFAKFLVPVLRRSRVMFYPNLKIHFFFQKICGYLLDFLEFSGHW